MICDITMREEQTYEITWIRMHCKECKSLDAFFFDISNPRIQLVIIISFFFYIWYLYDQDISSYDESRPCDAEF